ncbi:hypothetical protein M0802_002474 [Mischocyttarus mexicanus]|nr:hypothetical protein M0802_002474 [Mischocyttarus mexicanus]
MSYSKVLKIVQLTPSLERSLKPIRKSLLPTLRVLRLDIQIYVQSSTAATATAAAAARQMQDVFESPPRNALEEAIGPISLAQEKAAMAGGT